MCINNFRMKYLNTDDETFLTRSYIYVYFTDIASVIDELRESTQLEF